VAQDTKKSSDKDNIAVFLIYIFNITYL